MKKTKTLGLVTIAAIIVLTVAAIFVGQWEANNKTEPKQPRGIKALESESSYYTSEGGSLSISNASPDTVNNPSTSRTDKKFSYTTTIASYTGTVHYDLKTKVLTFTTDSAVFLSDGSAAPIRTFNGTLSGKRFTFEGDSYDLRYDANEMYDTASEQIGGIFGNIFSFLFILFAAAFYGADLLIFAIGFAIAMKGKTGGALFTMLLGVITLVLEAYFAFGFSSFAWALFMPISILQIAFFFVVKSEKKLAGGKSVEIN